MVKIWTQLIRTAVWLLLLCIYFICAQRASAGHYVVTYTTSGAFAVVNGSPAVQNYYPSTPPFTGTASVSGSFFNQGSVGSSLEGEGSINGIATWTPDYPGDPEPLPDNVIVMETCSVDFTTTGVVGSGMVSDGLGGTTVSSGSGLWSSLYTTSYRNSVQSPPGSAFSRTVDPEVIIGPVHYPSSNSSFTATITYTMQVYPITIDLTGTVLSSSLNKLAVGQKLLAKVNTHGLPTHPSDSYTWVKPVGAYPFANYQVSSAAAVFTPFTVPGNVDTMGCYFGKPGTSIVQCTFHSGLLGFNILAKGNVTVAGPVRTQVAKNMGSMQLLVTSPPPTVAYVAGLTSNPTDFRLWGATYAGQTSGIYYADKLKDPAFLVGTHGQWGYAQIVNSLTTRSGQANVVQTGLDGGFPRSGFFTADGTTIGTMNDQPGFGGLNSLTLGQMPFTGSYSGTYKTYHFYKAPSNAAGTSVYIPVNRFDWNAQGTCGTSDLITWTQNDTGSTGPGNPTTYATPFPTW